MYSLKECVSDPSFSVVNCTCVAASPRSSFRCQVLINFKQLYLMRYAFSSFFIGERTAGVVC